MFLDYIEIWSDYNSKYSSNNNTAFIKEKQYNSSNWTEFWDVILSELSQPMTPFLYMWTLCCCCCCFLSCFFDRGCLCGCFCTTPSRQIPVQLLLYDLEWRLIPVKFFRTHHEHFPASQQRVMSHNSYPISTCAMTYTLTHSQACDEWHMHVHTQPYLHCQCSSLLVVVIQEIGHEGGVIRQILAHSQSDGLAGKLAVALYGLHVNADSRRHQGEEEWEEGDEEGGRTGSGHLPVGDCRSTWEPVCHSSSFHGCSHFNLRHFSS